MADPATQYWLIKAILLTVLLIIMWVIVRPVRTQGHLALRRVITVLTLVFAMFAILFPGLLNRVAWRLGVDRGINLLVYVLVLALFAQIATAYRRDSTAEKRMTELARAIALDTVRVPASAVPPATIRPAAPARPGGDEGDSPGPSGTVDATTTETLSEPRPGTPATDEGSTGPTVRAEWTRGGGGAE